MHHRLRLLLPLVLLLTGFSLPVESQTPRQTDDAMLDAVDALMQDRRFDDAVWLCDTLLKQSNPGEMSHARWQAKRAMVVADQAAVELFAFRIGEMIERLDGVSDQVCNPIETLRQSYPDSSAALFLSATELQVRQRLLRAVIIAASVSSVEDGDEEDLLRRIARLQGDADRLLKDVKAKRDRLSGLGQVSARAEHERLVRELVLQRISLAVMQTELFVEGSDDFVSASVDAVNLIRPALLEFPDNTPAKRTANYWLASCTLASGDTQSSGKAILNARKMSVADGADRWLALAIRHALATGDLAGAKRMSAGFYGSGPTEAVPRSSEMDFAQLRILLSEPDGGDAVARWLDVIEFRGDAFARRRAEAIAVSSLGRPKTPRANAGVNPVIIAAQGEALIRQGDNQRGAALLRAAALADSDTNRAFEFATKSAAATLATDPVATIDVLHSVAMNHFGDSEAAGVSYAAALHAAKQTDAKVLKELKDRSMDVRSILQEMYATWPTSIHGRRANEWLCEIHIQSGDLKSAAYAASEYLVLEEAQSAFDRTASAWFAWVSSLEPDKVADELVVFEESLHELLITRPELRRTIHGTAAWLLDQPNRVGEVTLSPSEIENPFLQNVARLRSQETRILAASITDETLLERVRWRLVRDGILEPKKQALIGNVLREWPGADAWQSARSELWAEVTEKSIAEVVLLGLKRGPGATERAIQLLRETESLEATKAAITLADRISNRSQIGSEKWHDWKLKAIEWLEQTGQHDEAAKRAKYILLTRPPEDADRKRRYESHQ
ncbi:MAG: hypothetical protein AAFX06_17125 [Planctomycetota bacterium]